MRRAFTILILALVLPGLGVSLFLAGCGSAGSGDYERGVSELNKTASEKLGESLHLLGAEELEGEEERVRAVVAALEEAVLIINESLAELKEIKVPAGMEEFHRELMSFYHANLAAYGGYISTLEPGDEHGVGEGEEHGEEESAESHEEETTPAEEEPAEGGGH